MHEGMMERPDGASIYYKAWDDVENPVACIQIAHGMGEHIERYEGFAQYLNDNGIIVYGNDHRGHGKTVKDIEKLGSFGREDAWPYLVKDMEALSRLIRRRERHIPLFLLGHSMGSFLARTYITTMKDPLAGAIICGTGGSPGLIGKAGQALINFEIRKNGWQAKSLRINDMIFGGNNKAFNPARTLMDWLNRDEEEVDKYLADPYCGGQFDNGFFKDLLKGLFYINSMDSAKKIRKDLPIFFISGEEDPVGAMGKGVKESAELYRKAGIKDVRMKLYPKARHEILLELNREEVYKDIIHWIREVLGN